MPQLRHKIRGCGLTGLAPPDRGPWGWAKFRRRGPASRLPYQSRALHLLIGWIVWSLRAGLDDRRLANCSVRLVTASGARISSSGRDFVHAWPSSPSPRDHRYALPPDLRSPRSHVAVIGLDYGRPEQMSTWAPTVALPAAYAVGVQLCAAVIVLEMGDDLGAVGS
ncbi:hypothetical protein ZEAMMB73_Zm00001d030811 [Zea mays]|uniref:Uncharacterized protein n=1 Tax=Zea mays TaxID=4577 RepID=A0A1D6KEJ7_MAIZE|nr:hypothetical protein ZEAMMB73_Zm00001d030811 [Zea mays]